jgi:hypothetical protein
MRTIGAVAMAILALGGVLTSAASAKKVGVLTPTFGAYLLPGAFIELEGFGVNGKTTSGSVECEEQKFQGLVGKLATNWEKIDKIEVRSARGIYYGGGTCKSTLPIGGKVKMYWFGGSPLGTVLINAFTEKWEYKANAANETEIEFYSAETEAFCTYGVKKIKGFWESIPFTFFDLDDGTAKVKLVGHNLANCPKKMELETGFRVKNALTSEEQAEERATEVVEMLYRDTSEKP